MLAGRNQPDMAGYTELKYVMRCVNESMRLYPHPPVLLRRAEFADTLPGAALSLSCSIAAEDPHLQYNTADVGLHEAII